MLTYTIKWCNYSSLWYLVGSVDLGNSNVKGWPVTFHPVHSTNIQLSSDKRRAKRIESFCKGICFGNRPMNINERVYIKFAEVSTSWSGVLRFGYVAHDPLTIDANSLPRYACPDLTNKPGYWAKALLERYSDEGNILFFYFTRQGEVMYGVNGEDKGVFFSGVTTNTPLWPLVDIYGNTLAMEFVGKWLFILHPHALCITGFAWKKVLWRCWCEIVGFTLCFLDCVFYSGFSAIFLLFTPLNLF